MLVKYWIEMFSDAIGPGALRRGAALLLSLVLCLGVFPQSAYATRINENPNTETAGEDAGEAPEDSGEVSDDSWRSGIDSGSLNIPDNFQSMKAAAGTVSAGRSMTNTYILEVSSGTFRGGGTADNILYFSVQYTDTDNIHRDVFLLPVEDAQQTSLRQAYQQGNREKRREDVERLFGYTAEDMLEKKALGNVQTNQLLFTTPQAVKSIDAISVFGRRTGTASSWSCQGMRIYRVDTLYGLDMYGWYSDWGYIDFSGEVMAQVMMASGTGNLHWVGSGGVYNFVGLGEQGGANGCWLITPETKARYEQTYSKTCAVGEKHESQTASPVVFRLDLADVGGAGLETLAGSYEAGGRKSSTVSALKLCETAALTIRYTDTFGCIREVVLPVAVNALGQTVDVLGDVAIAGYAQQGDSIAFQAMLPDFQTLNYVYLTLGEPSAVAASHLSDVAPAQYRTVSGNVQVAGTNVTQGPPLGMPLYIRPGAAALSMAVSWSGSSVSIQAPAAGKSTWRIEDAGDGTYYIANSDGKVLAAASAAVLTSRTGAVTQRWTVQDAGDGWSHIVSAADTSLYLGVLGDSSSTGTVLYLAKKSGTDGQKFTLKTLTSSELADDTSARREQESDSAATQPNTLRDNRIADSAADDIRYTCFAVYQQSDLKVQLKGATIQYKFEGVPTCYTTAPTAEGQRVPVAARTAFSLQTAEEGKPPRLRVSDGADRYLITVYTDTVGNAGTADDIDISFRFTNMQGEEETSTVVNAREAVRSFYGEWPGNEKEFAYLYGFSDGSTARFLATIPGVRQFLGASFKLGGQRRVADFRHDRGPGAAGGRQRPRRRLGGGGGGQRRDHAVEPSALRPGGFYRSNLLQGRLPAGGNPSGGADGGDRRDRGPEGSDRSGGRHRPARPGRHRPAGSRRHRSAGRKRRALDSRHPDPGRRGVPRLRPERRGDRLSGDDRLGHPSE